jgi:hypothetical protein
MWYIYESIFVGIYCVILYLLFSNFIKSFYISLVIIGFLKHLLSYYIGLHTFYCNYGNACKKHKEKYISIHNNIIIDSFKESILFLIVGGILKILFKKIKNDKIRNIIIYFLIGIMLHIFFELYGLHKFFCKNNCKMI